MKSFKKFIEDYDLSAERAENRAEKRNLVNKLKRNPNHPDKNKILAQIRAIDQEYKRLKYEG